MSLIAEMKRRNVFKVGAAYLALAWIVVQITATLTPAFHLPDSALPLVSWIGVIGFPFVLLFSWVYEMTPEGLKRESEIDRNQSITQVTGRKLDYIIIGLLVAAIAVTVLDHFAPREAREENSRAEARPTTSPSAGATANADGAVGRASARQDGAPDAVMPDPHSIAVLPFVNMSEDASNAFFADGISEELLNLLVKVPELQVTSRSSAFAYKGKEIDIPVVAAKLNVANVLEGSVRKSGNRVRITAQLVDARRDKHLWSETYDRDLNDIFAVQDEIAAAVVAQLKLTLLGDAPKAKVANPEAYAMFLQARALRRRNSAESFEQAIELNKKAIELDPTFAEPWDELGRTYISQASANVRPNAEAYAMAREAVARALAIDPKLARAHDNLGWIAANYDLDMATAAQHYRQALALEPGNSAIRGNAATVLWNLGRLDQALAVLKTTYEREATNTVGLSNLGGAYLAAGRLDDALRAFHLLQTLAPDYLGSHAGAGQVLLLRGEPQAALAEAQQEQDEVTHLCALAQIQHTLGDRAQSDQALASLVAAYSVQVPFQIATVHAWRGEADEAFAWLDKAVAAHDPILGSILSEPFIAKLRQDPRWMPFLLRIHMTPEQLAAIELEVSLPP